MGIVSGARIVEDGLIFHYDMDNTSKSFIGIPSENEFDMSQMLRGSYGGDGTVQTGVPDPFGGNNPVYRKTGKLRFGVTDGTNVGTLYNGNQYMFSIYLRHVPNEVEGGSMEFDIVDRAGTRNFSGNLGDAMTYEWQRFYTYATHDNNVNYHFIDIGIYQGTNVFEWSCPMIEQTTRTWPAPFVSNGGTRSNTEAIVDLTGNSTITANSLTYNNDGTFKFNGTSDYMNAGSIPELNGSSTISLDAWLKVDNLATTDRKIICYKRDANTDANFQLRRGYNSDGLYYQWHNGAWKTFYIDNFFSNTTDWHHVSIVHNPSASNQVVCYKNGEEFTDTFGADSTALNWQAATLFIGYRTAAEYFDGNISNVKIYNRALSAAEVKQNFEASRSRYGI
jgi:hypothetical protein